MMEGKSWHGGLPWYLALAYLNASPSMEYLLAFDAREGGCSLF